MLRLLWRVGVFLLVVGCCGVVVGVVLLLWFVGRWLLVVVGVFANGAAAVPESVVVLLTVVVCSEGASSGW